MGTWASPNTVEKAKQLQKLLTKSLSAKVARDKLYDIFGDDDLFDHITRVEQKYGKDYDVRGIVEVCLQDMLCYSGCAIAWDKKTLEICEKICSLN
jgi:hypothetical protein